MKGFASTAPVCEQQRQQQSKKLKLALQLFLTFFLAIVGSVILALWIIEKTH